MKKSKVIILLIIFLIGGLLIGRLTAPDKVYDDEKEEPKVTKNENTLSMMIEQTAGAGDYQMETRTSWPTDGYKFNETLSKCENGGELGWDESKGVVTMTGNMSDKCYIYFDIYTPVTINNLSVTNTETTITIAIDATSTNGAISKYYYSIDDGENYVNSTTNSYTFNITEIRTYKIKVYAVDILGKKSSISSKDQIVTARPTNPTMAFDSTYNVVISGSTSKNGSVEYYYSLDNSTYTQGTSVSVSSTSTIYAYAIDIKNQKSDVVSKTITIGTPSTGTVTSTYYCSKTYSYQSSSTCSYSYNATKTLTPSCSNTDYDALYGYCFFVNASYTKTYSDCSSSCNSSYRDDSPLGIYRCIYGTYMYEGYHCAWAMSETDTTVTTYSCPNGGTLSSTTCTGATYTATTKYKCSLLNGYYDSQDSATSACTNYCASGTYYNSKCYKMS